MTHRDFLLVDADGREEHIGTLTYPTTGIFATREINDDFFMDYALWCPACGRAWLKSPGNRPQLAWPQSSFGWGIQARYCSDHFPEWEQDRGPPRHAHTYNTAAGPAPGTVLWNTRYSSHIGHGLWVLLLGQLSHSLRHRELDAWVRADLAVNADKPLLLEFS
jgi:hypothetical protein